MALLTIRSALFLKSVGFSAVVPPFGGDPPSLMIVSSLFARKITPFQKNETKDLKKQVLRYRIRYWDWSYAMHVAVQSQDERVIRGRARMGVSVGCLVAVAALTLLKRCEFSLELDWVGGS